jgi:nicotinamidase-related amidase
MTQRMPRTALIVTDMINTYEHADGDRLARSVERSLPAIEGLIRRARESETLTIYVNDNHGAWRSSRQELIETALGGEHGRLVEPIAPPDDALFVVKARHSIFFQTPLEYLLAQEGVDRLVLTGQVTEQCILYSALDAYIRHHEVAVPRDAVAHIHAHLADAALELMALNMDAEVCDAADCEL